MKGFLLWLAQGFGVGRIPIAPGTFGSVVGFLWTALLIASGNLWIFLIGTIAGLAVSVWICGEGEKILNQKDPGSIVMDEIAAIPLCFWSWILVVFCKTGSMPSVEYFLSQHVWLMTIGIFLAFRLFDIWKPWPARQSQSLPGGWGVTIDDAFAALYVNVVTLAVFGATVL